MKILENNKKVTQDTIVAIANSWFSDNPLRRAYKVNSIGEVELDSHEIETMTEYVYQHDLCVNLELSDQDYIIDCIKLFYEVACRAISKFITLSTPEMFDIDMDRGYDEYTADLLTDILTTQFNLVDEYDTTDEGYYALHNLVANELHRLYYVDYAKYLVYNKPIVGSTDKKTINRFKLDDYDYKVLFEAGYFDFMACQDIRDWNCTYDMIAIMLTDAPLCKDFCCNAAQIINYLYGLTDCRDVDDAFRHCLDAIKTALAEIVERHIELNSNSTLADLFKLLTKKMTI